MKQITLIIITVTFLFYTLIQGSCKKEEPPTLKTLSVSEIAATTAKSGGNITDDGGSDINSKGIVWGITPEPTVDHYTGITMEGTGKDIFLSTLTNLSPETQYYVRAYASNSAGIAYGCQKTFSTTTSTIPKYPPGYVHCYPANPTIVVDVTNPKTGKTWMDRNLGAFHVATSPTDINAYGDLYQWGRFADGHQCRASDTTPILSTTDQPGHGNFILAPNYPRDWRSPQNTNLWQGVNGVNNPCPEGYRLPTKAELEAERSSWDSNLPVDSFVTPLRLPMAGYRHPNGSVVIHPRLLGHYWSSTVSGTSPRLLHIVIQANYIFSDMIYAYGALGSSVRCIKD